MQVKKLEVDGDSEKKEVSKMDGMEVRSVFRISDDEFAFEVALILGA